MEDKAFQAESTECAKARDVNAGECSGGSQWFRVALALGNRRVQAVNSMDIWENSGNKSANGNKPTAHTELW